MKKLAPLLTPGFAFAFSVCFVSACSSSDDDSSKNPGTGASNSGAGKGGTGTAGAGKGGMGTGGSSAGSGGTGGSSAGAGGSTAGKSGGGAGGMTAGAGGVSAGAGGAPCPSAGTGAGGAPAGGSGAMSGGGGMGGATAGMSGGGAGGVSLGGAGNGGGSGGGMSGGGGRAVGGRGGGGRAAGGMSGSGSSGMSGGGGVGGGGAGGISNASGGMSGGGAGGMSGGGGMAGAPGCNDIPPLAMGDASFTISSPDFGSCMPIPAASTCDAKPFPQGTSPALTWTAGPAGTMSYAVVLKDLSVLARTASTDANYNRGYHYVMWDIPTTVTTLPKAMMGGFASPDVPGAAQWSNFNNYGFFGPCPNFDPTMPTDYNDVYAFVVYALPTAKADVPAPVMGMSTVRLLDDSFKAVALAVAEYRGTSSAHSSGIPCGVLPPMTHPPCPTTGTPPDGCLAVP